MPRQVRIEFPGAIYHVMARGDRSESIVRDDEDRRTFFANTRRRCERAGFRVHAYVLMTNHYHLLLETKEPNLSRGMAWLQNAFTRRINTRHRLWGHVFGGRYKAILVEPGNCFWALLDYIHLNPVRAGLVKSRDGLDFYPWSSLRHYIAVPKMRPGWQETEMAFTVTGCKDTPTGRRKLSGNAGVAGRLEGSQPCGSSLFGGRTPARIGGSFGPAPRLVLWLPGVSRDGLETRREQACRACETESRWLPGSGTEGSRRAPSATNSPGRVRALRGEPRGAAKRCKRRLEEGAIGSVDPKGDDGPFGLDQPTHEDGREILLLPHHPPHPANDGPAKGLDRSGKKDSRNINKS